MTKIYKELLKIKRPVLISVDGAVGISDRFRILYPTGLCEYFALDGSMHIKVSCFAVGSESLVETVEAMYKYDIYYDIYFHRMSNDPRLKVTAFQEI